MAGYCYECLVRRTWTYLAVMAAMLGATEGCSMVIIFWRGVVNNADVFTNNVMNSNVGVIVVVVTFALVAVADAVAAGVVMRGLKREGETEDERGDGGGTDESGTDGLEEGRRDDEEKGHGWGSLHLREESHHRRGEPGLTHGACPRRGLAPHGEGRRSAEPRRTRAEGVPGVSDADAWSAGATAAGVGLVVAATVGIVSGAVAGAAARLEDAGLLGLLAGSLDVAGPVASALLRGEPPGREQAALVRDGVGLGADLPDEVEELDGVVVRLVGAELRHERLHLELEPGKVGVALDEDGIGVLVAELVGVVLAVGLGVARSAGVDLEGPRRLARAVALTRRRRGVASVLAEGLAAVGSALAASVPAEGPSDARGAEVDVVALALGLLADVGLGLGVTGDLLRLLDVRHREVIDRGVVRVHAGHLGAGRRDDGLAGRGLTVGVVGLVEGLRPFLLVLAGVGLRVAEEARLWLVVRGRAVGRVALGTTPGRHAGARRA